MQLVGGARVGSSALHHTSLINHQLNTAPVPYFSPPPKILSSWEIDWYAVHPS